ncbi:MAG: PQQ-dependent sugar dehydrogenase [Sphingomonadaceae bacterium]
MRLPALALAFLPAAALAAPPVVKWEVAAEPGVRVETFATGLAHPWSLAFLPDGRMLDVALAPDFATSRILYFSHATGTSEANATAVSRARLDGSRLQDVQQILRNPRNKRGAQHFGSRLLFLPDNSLLVSIGDGGNPPVQLDGANIRDQAQNGRSWFGSVLRVTADGKPAAGNPGKGWDPNVWTIGHRNIQGLARDPKTGTIWSTEHGARGGDELNRMTAGANYGWPVVTYSVEYSGRTITNERSRPGMTDPVSVWTPSTAASGLAVYRGSVLGSLDGALLAGGLMSQDVRVIRIGADGRPTRETRIEIGERVRDVRVGPDGLVYVLTDEPEGKILRIRPQG